ncbi:MAG: dependent ligase [Caulobacteraceae bacterium]|nr:dependent ligase [Caulobacteraceae bacterium]
MVKTGTAMFAVAAPMEARAMDHLPEGDGWWFEPKWDGFRCLAFRDGAEVRLQAKSGKPLARYFPEVVARLAALETPDFILDGELLVGGGANGSFETLQLRLHPSESRVRRLARETPASLTVFDMLLAPDGRDLRPAPLRERRAALQTFVERLDAPGLSLTSGSCERAVAEAWLADPAREGVVAKRWDGPYLESERAMVKVKRSRTADCVVGGFRYAAKGDLVGSLLLGLYDDEGHLNHVGFTSGIPAAEKPALTRRLETLRGGPGFTGSKPGGPSRWATERSTVWTPLRPELVAEVAFDHVSDGRFRHGTRLVRLRPDKAPEQCRMDQLA